MTADLPLRCQCRRKAVTGLRCARCLVPICPDCSLVGPVGMLCRECGRGQTTSVNTIPLETLGRAVVATMGAALVLGWLLMGVGRSFGWFGLWFAFLYGLAVAEVAARASGRKRGWPIELLTGGSAALGILVGGLAHGLGRELPWLELLSAFFLNPWNLVTLIVAVVIAVGRARSA